MDLDELKERAMEQGYMLIKIETKCRKCGGERKCNSKGRIQKCVNCMPPQTCRVCGAVKPAIEFIKGKVGIIKKCLECVDKRKCSKCKDVKFVDEFHVNAKYCKECVKEYRRS